MAIWEKVRQRLKRTRDAFEVAVRTRGLKDSLDQLQALLVEADLGLETTEMIIASVQERIKSGLDWPMVQEILVQEICALLAGAERDFFLPSFRPGVALFVGVNGSGKTTTVAKVARLLSQNGAKVCLAAADTFRAAAIDQLRKLGEQVGVEVVAHRPGADPGAVVHDAVEHAKHMGYDIVLVDTAGRLQTKRPLMEELAKICRVVEKVRNLPPDERILVVDATVGQNAISQARLFHEAVGLTGLAVAKLDGTAKGGAIIPVWRALGIPILWVGIGEGLGDLEQFRAREFACALIGR